ncbi:protein SUPPRESSOR OF SILENCING 3 [Tripterygium wilfordii]|uniref:Protein SUPPRESSOR OF SILENCING 3 n=1 Tax=Tripterygium wilfordii TaxID=458696 RepID=A0A7J7D8E4_TRIWF|nr:protein SUPPRESSOR OF GENE SILENCING 3-like [Tripterygium wilfordii]KAF5742602.1 protein SUPPRESSOR OF SILENCING 3 [Tripterygium wilfordii]
MSAKGGFVSEASSSMMEPLADSKMDPAQSDGDGAVSCRKSKDIAGSSAPKTWDSHNPNLKAWSHPDVVQKLCMLSNGGSGSASGCRKKLIADSMDDTKGNKLDNPDVVSKNDDDDDDSVDDTDEVVNKSDDDDDDDDGDADDSMDDTDDEDLSDDFDSDSSQKSHETRKKCKWFKNFFESLDALSFEEVNNRKRPWHCPACQFGPGAINWYQGLQPLMTHARTKGRKRVKLHREFTELLEEELRRRGAPVIPVGEAFGNWKGLMDDEKDHLIVWPPMVVIMNTRLEQDFRGQWVGMGNQELRDYFSSYGPFKPRHSYGPQGHRGISILIFESSAGGYVEAERLHRQFVEQGSDRRAWESGRRVLFCSGGKRQLYGYMAVEEDLEYFDQHSHGKSKVKYDLKSYEKMFVNQIKHMTEANQQLSWFRNKAAKQETRSKALEEIIVTVSTKLRKTLEENRIVKQRSKVQHEQNKEELDFQEQFFKNQISSINEARDEREANFEKLQLEECEKIGDVDVNPSNIEQYKQRVEEIANRIQLQGEVMKDFVADREKLIKVQEDKIAATKRRYWEEMMALENAFDAELAQLRGKYAPQSSVVEG